MSKFSFSLNRETLIGGEALGPARGHRAIWVINGSVAAEGRLIGPGCGDYIAPDQAGLRAGGTGAEILVFEIVKAGQAPAGHAGAPTLLAEHFNLDETLVFLRLDQVTFPPGACAYRHTHPGPGIRYLTQGTLDIHADVHTSKKKPGEAWFEDANSPVKAIASAEEVSSFVRAMVLPMEYLGKPTIRILDRNDDLKPKLQTNKRFFDKRLQF